MSIHADFGPLIVETDVDGAVIGTLKLWLPTYLAQAERDRGLASRTLARPKPESYANTLEDDEFLDHRLPAILVTTASAPAFTRMAGGVYEAIWTVAVSSVVRGDYPSITREIASVFNGCVRLCLTQQGHLDDFANGVRAVSSNLARVSDSTDQGRFLAVGVSAFQVRTENVMDDDLGPVVPGGPYDDPDPAEDPDTPYEPLVNVSSVTTTIEGVPIPETPGDDG